MNQPDLYALLQSDPEAKRYFNALPDYVREQISTMAEGLQDYAENLLRGDD